jgi:hypothetical protein
VEKFSMMLRLLFLERVFKERIPLIDKDPDLRKGTIENVSLKYPECSGLLMEASSG